MSSHFPYPADERVVPVADLFRLLGDPTRLRIVLACVDERRAVGVIAESLGLSQSLVSHHLRLLRAARVVRAEREASRCSTSPPTGTSAACSPTCWNTYPNRSPTFDGTSDEIPP